MNEKQASKRATSVLAWFGFIVIIIITLEVLEKPQKIKLEVNIQIIKVIRTGVMVEASKFKVSDRSYDRNEPLEAIKQSSELF